tara:strand:+ start:737 stop:2074 length:1338 start_codon:yes stop_codon:yes gene_type:complete
MGKYICKICGQDFKQRSHYTNHLNRKRPCKSIKDKIRDIEDNKEQFSDLSKNLTKELDKNTKKKGGIFFTPYNIIEKTYKSVEKAASSNNLIINNILEPSCGSCEFIKYIDLYLKSVSIDAIEYNKQIYDSIKDIKFTNNVKLYNQDYLKTENNKYDLIIGNPPYFVMSKKEVDKRYHKYFDGRPNIFVIFILHSLSKLNENGILSFVLPYSFCNCTYYNKLRKHIVDNYDIIEIIDCSKDKYLETAQDTIIFTLVNRKGDNTKFTYNKNDITLLNTVDKISKIKALYTNSTSIDELGLYVKVGDTVWNQVKESLTDDINKTRLIYSGDIKNNELVITEYSNPDKKNYIDKDGEMGPLLIVNRGYGVGGYKFNYCLIHIKSKYSIENHLITIRSKEEISSDELVSKYKMIIKSFDNKKTSEFIDIYCSNSALNTNELQYMLPIYV